MNKSFTLTLAAWLLLSAFFPVLAQDEGKKKKKKKEEAAAAPAAPAAPAKPAEPKKSDTKSVAETVKAYKKMPGLFHFYQDTVEGSVYMQIQLAQLGKEFIYFQHFTDGAVDAGAYRGSYGANTVFKINRYFNKVEFETQNTSFYFDPQSPLNKAAKANITTAIFLSEKITAQDSTSLLIKADGLFLTENLTPIKPIYPPNYPPFAYRVGGLSRDKTKYLYVRNYPKNSDIAVEYVFDNPAPMGGTGDEVTDPRFVSVKAQHSFLEMPQNSYQPRNDDPRVGYFMQQINDMTTARVANYRDVINRWHLEKKDPNAEISEPVEPITWWIENTTPLEWRETITEAALEWNKAFEKAGFRNAMVVKVQPDNADWDAGDIRYNVLRWTSSPQPPFGGYGPSFVNPRTGQILGADIMLEYVYFTNRVRAEKLYDGTLHHADEHDHDHHDPRFCSFGQQLQSSMMLGEAALRAAGGNDFEITELRRQALKELVMHELGHTLGLNHNMKASQLYTPEQLNDKSLTAKTGMSGSVMDYLPINVAKDRSKQGHYFSVTVGPYDLWAIEYGYKPVKTASELNAILARSTEPQLIFGNDADDMRAPGKAIDPRVNVDDHSNDAIRYATDRIELVNDLMKGLRQKYAKDGDTYMEFRSAYGALTGQIRNSASTISRYVGGVYVDRAHIGQAGGTKPYTPVAYQDQKRAMNALAKHIFAPTALQTPNELYQYLAMQRRGYNFFPAPEDPKIHTRVLGIQVNALMHLLHPNTTQRILDSEMYGNKYKLSEMMTDLNNAIFAEDAATNVNTLRQNLQIEYTKMLIGALSAPGYANPVRSMVLMNLQNIRKIASNGLGDVSTKAHKEHLKLLIEKALDD